MGEDSLENVHIEAVVCLWFGSCNDIKKMHGKYTLTRGVYGSRSKMSLKTDFTVHLSTQLSLLCLCNVSECVDERKKEKKIQ